MTGPSTLWILKNLSDVCVKWGPLRRGIKLQFSRVLLQPVKWVACGSLFFPEKKNRPVLEMTHSIF